MRNVIPTTLNCTFEGDTLPKYDKEGDSAMDVYAWKFQEVINGGLSNEIYDFDDEGYILPSLGRILVKSGLCVEFVDGISCDCRPRSGMTLKYGIMTALGLCDNNYRGDLGLIVMNLSGNDYVIKKGERLGQILFSSPIKVKLNVVDKLNETNRGANGFGSSGK